MDYSIGSRFFLLFLRLAKTRAFNPGFLMGIRFACHVCAKQLNIKEELAGKRGICPACSSKFRIPKQDAERSLPIEDPPGRVEPSSDEPSSVQSRTGCNESRCIEITSNPQTSSAASRIR